MARLRTPTRAKCPGPSRRLREAVATDDVEAVLRILRTRPRCPSVAEGFEPIWLDTPSLTGVLVTGEECRSCQAVLALALPTVPRETPVEVAE